MNAIRRALNGGTPADLAPVFPQRDGTCLRMFLFVLLTLVVYAAMPARAAGTNEGLGHQHHMPPEISRSVANYRVPDVRLVRDDGKSVDLRGELDDDRPVILSFIYTSCTTICPVTSATLAELQSRLGAARDSVRIASISIDPEEDTPARLHVYARKFGAGPEWHHYTGTLEASVATQKAFGVYQGDKMSHAPVSLVRLARGGPWIRIEGFATADQLLGVLRQDVASR